MHSFWFFFWKFFTFFEKFSQVAILKLEHCGLFYLVAYGCLHNSLYFESDYLTYFWEKNWKTKIFENLDFGFRKVYGRSTKFSKWETKNIRFGFGINKLSNAKKRNVLPLKLRPVKTFKVGKKKTFQESIWKMTNNWHCLPADRSMVCVFWTAQRQHSQESVRNWAVRASGADNGHQIWKKGYDWSKQALTCYDALWQQRPHALLLAHLCTPARRTSRCRMVMVVIPC